MLGNISISNQYSNNPKNYTYGFTSQEVTSLEHLSELANKFAISTPNYSDGHRNNKNILAGSHYILIDCDEPYQAERIETKIQAYNYVKVPSQSNLHYPYKYHFIIPTQKELSTNLNIFKYQVNMFFNQAGITSEDIDISGSFDIVRQFAPAVVDKYISEKDSFFYGLTEDESEELTVVNDTGLNVPIIENIPEDYINITRTSVTPDKLIDSVNTDLNTLETIKDNILDRSKSIYYQGIKVSIDDVEAMIFKTITESSHQYISGFGCPCCNQAHTDKPSKPYGFAFINTLGNITIKCTGNACRDNPYYTIPLKFDELVSTQIPTEPQHKIQAKEFQNIWETKLLNISNNNLLINWEQNFSAFDKVIANNRLNLSPEKIVIPSQTGSGKSQQIIAQAISLADSNTLSLIVVLRTSDCDVIAKQIQDGTSKDYVAVYHTNQLTEDVSLANRTNIDKYKCLVITHSMFLNHQTLTDNRDFIVIDEAINAINHIEISNSDLITLNKIYKSKKLNSATTQIIEGLTEALSDVSNKLDNNKLKELWGDNGLSIQIDVPDRVCYDVLDGLDFIKIKLSVSGTEIQNKAIGNRLFDLLDSLPYLSKNWCYVSKSANDIKLNTALEIIPNKSIVIMDATASVNSVYKLHSRYKKNLIILPRIDCRNYQNVILYKTKAISTGRNTITNNVNGYIKSLADNVIKDLQLNDKILVVSFKEVLPELKSYFDGYDIYCDNWGNLTGTNKYNHCNKIYLFGLNHKPMEVIRNNHTLAKGFNTSFLDNADNKQEVQMLKISDLTAEVLQAINRIKCRNTIDIKGNCEPCEVYLTLPNNSSEESHLMLDFISREMFSIQIKDWDFIKDNEVILERHNLCECYLETLDYMLTKQEEVKHDNVLYKANISNEQFRKHIKKHITYIKVIASKYTTYEKPRIDRYGRLKKSKDLFYIAK